MTGLLFMTTLQTIDIASCILFLSVKFERFICCIPFLPNDSILMIDDLMMFPAKNLIFYFTELLTLKILLSYLKYLSRQQLKYESD